MKRTEGEGGKEGWRAKEVTEGERREGGLLKAWDSKTKTDDRHM